MTMNLANINEVNAEAQEVLKQAQLLIERAGKLNQTVNSLDNTIENMSKVLGTEKESLIRFIGKPYTIIPSPKRGTYYVVVPKIIKGFNFGWLHKEDDSYFTYKIDQYSRWLADTMPEELNDILKPSDPINAQVYINAKGEAYLTYSEKESGNVTEQLKGYLSRETISGNMARIQKGKMFDVVVEIIRSGKLPFKPQPVRESGLKPGQSKIELRSYQEETYNEFMKWGAIGAFHPTGSGKSILAMYIAERLRGQKLIIVPTVTLKEQWDMYLREFIPHDMQNFTIKTYHSKFDSKEEYSLVIFDECQYLPANSFVKLSFIRTKFRIGLSTAPYREDGREEYIFALTGKPVGLNWQDYMTETGRKYPKVFVHRVEKISEKVQKAISLLTKKKKTFLFSDTLAIGRELSELLGVPFISGEMKEGRLDLVHNNRVVVLSRVGDVGVSDKSLEHIIEVDFLEGSRQQELQRMGRLMHSLKDGRHDIIFTYEEFEKNAKRLWGLRDKGFDIVMQN